MHTAVIQSPQAMSNDHSYRPRSPDLPGLTEPQHQQHQYQPQHQPPPLRLTRLPSYQIQEPSLPKGYSFSPRGSYDASPFFSQPLSQGQQSSPTYFSPPQGFTHSEQLPSHITATSLSDQPQAFSPVTYSESPHRHQTTNSFPKSPFQGSQLQQQLLSDYHQSQVDEMARLRSRKPVNYNEDHSQPQYEEPVPSYPPPQPSHQIPQQMQQMQQMQPMQSMQPIQQPSFFPYPPSHQLMQQQSPMVQSQQAPLPPPTIPAMPPMPHVDVKTKFPVARIKRIMQADEDVGKVAQATPTAVSKALEMFMIALVTKGAAEAKNNNSKRVTATHLKHALLTDPQFDFLNEICEAVPDEGAKGSKGRAKSEAKSEDSDEDMAGAPKRKAKASRKRKGVDDDGSD